MMDSPFDFFVLKKIVSLFIYPYSLALILVAGGVACICLGRRVRLGKWLAAMGVVFLIVQSVPYVPNECMRRLEYEYPPVLKETAVPGGAKWIVVLSGASTNNTYVPVTSRNSGDTLHRVVEGVVLANRFPEAKLLVSGGGYIESGPAANVMAEMARDLGVAPERIVMEPESRDTEEQARIIAGMVGGERVLLVTSALHMPRSMMLFEAYGVDVVAAPTAHVSTTHPQMKFLLFPSASGAVLSGACAHELIGMAWFKLKRVFK